MYGWIITVLQSWIEFVGELESPSLVEIQFRKNTVVVWKE